MLAESAALTAADKARNVHLCRGLRKGEVAGTKTNLGVGAEHLLGKRQEHLLQVGKRDVFIYIQAFHLMEETVGTGRDGFVAIDTSGADHTNGGRQLAVFRMHVFHDTSLNRRGV